MGGTADISATSRTAWMNAIIISRELGSCRFDPDTVLDGNDRARGLFP
jgi:coenzyme F420-reducing hydrogenase delta subunit